MAHTQRLFNCPPELASEIVAGNCVAFIGAGFSGAAKLPDWRGLLSGLAQEAGPELSVRVDAILGSDPSAEDFHLAAQLLEDSLGRERLMAGLRGQLHVDPDQLPPTMRRRVDVLRRVPFRAILTTNYDSLLGGELATRTSYVHALRPDGHRWFERRFWLDHPGPRVLALHGQLGTPEGERALVLTRRDYRRRLYQDPGYATFLRSLLSTRTVLYLGFSFTDAYLNELRSEVLDLLDFRHGSRPVAYAVVANSPPSVRDYYLQHEGVQMLDYSTAKDPNHAGFDRWLEAIYAAASPRSRFARLLAGKRVLWLDPHPENNETIRTFFASISAERPLRAGPVALEEVTMVEDAIARLRAARDAGQPHDLVITHWGEGEAEDWQGERLANGPRLLVRMRSEDLRAPVLVFSSSRDETQRRRTVRGLGAMAYCSRFETFFAELERVLV